jgi:alginate O-acetyltransferase complex protein AlgI
LIFNTAWFLCFFVFFFFCFWLMPNSKIRFYFTLASSVLFQVHFASEAGVVPILVMGTTTYFMALWIARLPAENPWKKTAFIMALLVPVGGLIGYKYRALLMGSLIAWVPGGAGNSLQAFAAQPALPLAISFFTFEFVHYLTDVYHGSKPVDRPFAFGFFAVFFPSVVAGPIKRYQPFLAQVGEGIPQPPLELVVKGLAQILLGYFKKLVVADNATIFIHLLEKNTGGHPLAVALLMFLLSIRILFDFSGYSDIAIGLAKMIGLELPVNFNYPYIASNITDFWRRWHMSLSSWIRDYLYIPLGGNRHGLIRKFFNLLLTMFVCGLWHGAAWHFGLWGIYHGAGLAVHNAWEKTSWRARFHQWSFSAWVGVAVTNVFVAFGWLLFFYPVNDVVRYTRTLFQW